MYLTADESDVWYQQVKAIDIDNRKEFALKSYQRRDFSQNFQLKFMTRTES